MGHIDAKEEPVLPRRCEGAEFIEGASNRLVFTGGLGHVGGDKLPLRGPDLPKARRCRSLSTRLPRAPATAG